MSAACSGPDLIVAQLWETLAFMVSPWMIVPVAGMALTLAGVWWLLVQAGSEHIRLNAEAVAARDEARAVRAEARKLIAELREGLRAHPGRVDILAHRAREWGQP